MTDRFFETKTKQGKNEQLKNTKILKHIKFSKRPFFHFLLFFQKEQKNNKKFAY